MSVITAERLRELLDYDPDSGIFTWRIDRPRAKAGAVAGCKANRRNGHYLVIRISQRNYYAHRLAVLWMTGKWPEQVDHRDGNTLNNRWSNIRECSPAENARNKTKLSPRNSSGFQGVFPTTGGFSAQISYNGKTDHLGIFDTAEDAARARDAVAIEAHGDFAALNLPVDGTPVPRRRVARSDNSSGFRGVHYRVHARRYAASCGGQHLGYFDTPELAAAAYDAKARELYGNRAVVNFP